MKYIFLVGDGMSDEPVQAIGNKTPLEAADISNMDYLAERGVVGMCKTIPDGMPPGSDVANLSLLGFDPVRYYTGRGPLEAASIGIELGKNDCAFRCNLINIREGEMRDFSAGHISTEEADEVISGLNGKLSDEGVRFYTGVSYRHICVIRGKFDNLRCTPPHDITGKNTGEYLPEGEGRETVRRLMDESIDLLKSSSVNKKRIDEGKTPATQIWLWGQGYKPELPSFPDRFGLKGSVITAVDLIRGIGGLAGLDVINVNGATGFVDTNYEGKADAAIESLKDRDFVFIHVEAPDEAGHAGDVDMKIKAIEEIDIRLLKRIIENVKGDFRMLIMPDHPTPISIKTHSRSPVPFILSGTGVKPNDVNIYTEAVARKSDIFIEKGHEVINLLFKNPH